MGFCGETIAFGLGPASAINIQWSGARAWPIMPGVEGEIRGYIGPPSFSIRMNIYYLYSSPVQMEGASMGLGLDF